MKKLLIDFACNKKGDNLDLIEQSKTIKAVSDPARLGALKLCFGKEVNVEEIREYLQMEPTLLSHHLKILKEREILISTRKGKRVFYKVNPEVRLKGSKKGLKFASFKIIFDI